MLGNLRIIGGWRHPVRHEHDASVRGAEHLRRLALEVSEAEATQTGEHLLTAREFGSRADGDPSLPLFLLEWTER